MPFLLNFTLFGSSTGRIKHTISTCGVRRHWLALEERERLRGARSQTSGKAATQRVGANNCQKLCDLPYLNLCHRPINERLHVGGQPERPEKANACEGETFDPIQTEEAESVFWLDSLLASQGMACPRRARLATYGTKLPLHVCIYLHIRKYKGVSLHLSGPPTLTSAVLDYRRASPSPG